MNLQATDSVLLNQWMLSDARARVSALETSIERLCSSVSRVGIVPVGTAVSDFDFYL
jgi:hypothetical protein